MPSEFEIDLHVVNPEREALKLVGVSYLVTAEGHELIRDVGKELPEIDAYGGGRRHAQSVSKFKILPTSEYRVNTNDEV
jgi:hypothetical protein